jgi:hypothetical protein
MAHEFARTLQETVRIGKLGAAKESDVYMSGEGVHIGERGVIDASGGMTVVQQLFHIVSALSHDLKPVTRDFAQRTQM